MSVASVRGRSIGTDHSIRTAVLVAALAGLATAIRREREPGRDRRPPRIGESALGEPGEVLWYC